MNKRLALSLSTAATMVIVSASAQTIAITDSFHVRTESGGGGDSDPNTIERVDDNDFSGTLASNWSLNGGNTIAIYFAGEGILDGSISATFGGQALNIVSLGDGSNEHISAVGYLINPTVSTGDVAISSDRGTSGSRQSFAFGILSLSNVGSVAGAETRSGNGDLSYTIGSNGGFVLGTGVNNSYNNSIAVNISGHPDTALFAGAFDSNSSTQFAYGTTAAGSFTDAYSGDIIAASTLAFNAVPEPSSFALIAGFLGLTWVMLRRRS